MSTLILRIFWVVVLFSLTSLGWSQIKIAFLAPLTGDESILMPEAESLADITVALFKESTGLDVQLVKFDTQSDVSVGLNLANEIAQDPSIIATIGPFVNHICAATRQVFSNHDLASVSPRCSQTALASSAWPSFFQAIPSDQQQSGILVNHWLFGNFSWIRALLIEDRTSYATNLNFDVDTYMKNSLNFSDRVAVADNQLYFGDIADDLQEYDVRLVLFASLSALQQAELVKELHQRNFEGIVFFPNSGFNDEWLARAGEAAEGTYVSSFYPPLSQESGMQSYIERYQAKTNTTIGWSGALSLLGTYTTLKAVEACQEKLDRSCVIEQLSELALESTPLGIPISFEDGALKDVSFASYQVQEGKYVKVWPPEGE